MKKLLAAATVLTLSAASVASLAHAEQWVQVKKGEADSASLFVDKDNITEKNGLRFFILQSIMLRPEEKKEANRRHVAFLKHPVNCDTRSIHPPLRVQVIDARGKLLKSMDQKLDKVLKSKRSIYELPGGEQVFGVVCSAQAKVKPEASAEQNEQKPEPKAEKPAENPAE